MGYLKRRIIEAMEPKEEPPMEVLGWIPVEERLPDGEEDVLASFQHEDGSRSVDIGWFTTLANPREWRHYAASHRDMIPSHWMPLPQPPEMK